MNINLTFKDLTLLAVHSRLEKDGITLAINRPVLTKVTSDPRGTKSEVLFFLDDSDPRSAGQ